MIELKELTIKYVWKEEIDSITMPGKISDYTFIPR